jgi:hypothetical protein
MYKLISLPDAVSCFSLYVSRNSPKFHGPRSKTKGNDRRNLFLILLTFRNAMEEKIRNIPWPTRSQNHAGKFSQTQLFVTLNKTETDFSSYFKTRDTPSFLFLH